MRLRHRSGAATSSSSRVDIPFLQKLKYVVVGGSTAILGLSMVQTRGGISVASTITPNFLRLGKLTTLADDAFQDVSQQVSTAGPTAGPYPRNVDMETTYDKTKRPRFMLKHLTKAGGTYAHWILDRIFIGDHHLGVSNDDEALVRDSKQHHLVAIIVRNPCDWYVSWAHFNAGKAFNYRQDTFGPNPFLSPALQKSNLKHIQQNAPRDRHLSRSEFRAWYKNVRFPDGKGFMSFYLWMLVLRPECIYTHQRLARGEHWPHEESCRNLTQMSRDWEAWLPSATANCWIFHESFSEDLRECLRRYEASSDFGRGSVNWTKLEALLDNHGSLIFEDNRKSLTSAGARHQPCSYYFGGPTGISDDEIKASDPYLFSKFGYKGCCSGSTRQIF